MKCIYICIAHKDVEHSPAGQRVPNERNGDSVSVILVHLIYIRSALATRVQLCICYKTKAPFMGLLFCSPFLWAQGTILSMQSLGFILLA